MFRLALKLGAALLVSAWAVCSVNPEQVEAAVVPVVLRAWESVSANPAPYLSAALLFLATVAYHKVRGKSLREAVETAATKVTVVAAPVHGEPEVVVRARNRATRTQLLADQIGLQNRLRKLPSEIAEAEKGAAWAEKAAREAREAADSKQVAKQQAEKHLCELRLEKRESEAEFATIQAELDRLRDLV